MQPGLVLDQRPVRLVEPDLGKIRHPAGVVGVAVGQQQLYGGVGHRLHGLPQVTVRIPRIQQQGFVGGGDQELPHMAVLKTIQIIHQLSGLQHKGLLLLFLIIHRRRYAVQSAVKKTSPGPFVGNG